MADEREFEKHSAKPIYPGLEELEQDDSENSTETAGEIQYAGEPRSRIGVFVGSFIILLFSFVTIKTYIASYPFHFAQVVGLILYNAVCLAIALSYLRTYCKTSYGVWGFNLISTLLLLGPDASSLPKSEKLFMDHVLKSGLSRDELMRSGQAFSFAYDWYGSFIASHSLWIWGIALFVTWAVYRSNLRRGDPQSKYYGRRYLKNPPPQAESRVS